MNTYTAHFYHQRMQTEATQDFTARGDAEALQTARRRFSDLVALRQAERIIWRSGLSLYTYTPFEEAESLEELAWKLEELAKRVRSAGSRGLSMEGPVRGGWLFLEEEM